MALYGWEEQGKIPREDVALRSLKYCLWFSLLTAAVAEMTNSCSKQLLDKAGETSYIALCGPNWKDKHSDLSKA